jgi:hypothetical protein
MHCCSGPGGGTINEAGRIYTKEGHVRVASSELFDCLRLGEQ